MWIKYQPALLKELLMIRLGGREGVVQYVGDDNDYPTILFADRPGGHFVKLITQMDLEHFPELEAWFEEPVLTKAQADGLKEMISKNATG